MIGVETPPPQSRHWRQYIHNVMPLPFGNDQYSFVNRLCSSKIYIFLWMSTKQSVALLFCTPGYRHNPPNFHLCGSRSVCNQRKLPTRGADAGCRCSRAHCSQDELSTVQDIMRELTPPTTSALLAWTLCKYPKQTLL